MSGDAQPELLLKCFTYHLRAAVIASLGVAVEDAGGWILERNSLSADAVQVVMETQPQSLAEVYGALVAAGLEMTRDSHRALAQQCNCSRYMPRSRSMFTILVLRIEISFVPAERRSMDLSRLFLLRTATA